ncbi:hypothetical protein Pan241w_20480 [Gimesia alba]|uniref:Uncharacterized protein n=1 Tax=Gimesia alba TaxID=2527973 RepID=A0A517RDL2_9PLAN|nr:hypothetical protein Pan241w_20480 [Gimesia alba]
MIVKWILGKGVGRSRGLEKRSVAKRGGMCCQGGGRCWLCGVMRRRVSTRITFLGLVGENRAQTSGLLDGAVCFVPGLHLNQ